MKNIIVAGSINMDLVVRSDEIPGVGETVAGNEFLTIPGGKGANQAVAISKLGGNCIFLGKVGKDDFGASVLNSMNNASINTQLVEKEDLTTGISIINVDSHGNNNIVFLSGANSKVDEAYIDKNAEVFDDATMVVMQHEIPLRTVEHILKLAKTKGVTTLLNPAPAMDLTDEIIENIDILVPNEHELSKISKMEVTDDQSVINAAKALLDKGIKKIVVTLGSRGVYLADGDISKFFDAYKTRAVDTTAAGDSFIGGFTNVYADTGDIEKAIDFGQRTAAIAITRLGAQTSIPDREEVENFNVGG